MKHTPSSVSNQLFHLLLDKRHADEVVFYLPSCSPLNSDDLVVDCFGWIILRVLWVMLATWFFLLNFHLLFNYYYGSIRIFLLCMAWNLTHLRLNWFGLVDISPPYVMILPSSVVLLLLSWILFSIMGHVLWYNVIKNSEDIISQTRDRI